MQMIPDRNSEPAEARQRASAEQRVLSYLCQPSADGAVRQQMMDMLRDHRFAAVEHQVLFDCLKNFPPGRLDLLESLLPERLVRAGFPDLDLTDFMRPCPLNAAEALELCRMITGEPA